MKIAPINQQSFNGTIVVSTPNRKEKAAAFSATLISGLRPSDNGPTWTKIDLWDRVNYKSATIECKHDINTVLNAYNAAKNTDLTVVLTE